MKFPAFGLVLTALAARPASAVKDKFTRTLRAKSSNGVTKAPKSPKTTKSPKSSKVPPTTCQSAFSFNPNIGADVGLDEDDEQINQTLGFSFPFGGNDYTTITVNDNGGIGLGSDVYINYDIAEDDKFESDFIDLGDPALLILNADTNVANGGSIHFSSSTGVALITWNGVDTYSGNGAALTFQMQLYPDGTIVYVYEDLTLAPPPNDTWESTSMLPEGIVVWIAPGDGSVTTGIDFTATAPFTSSGNVIYEIWCRTEGVNTCETTVTGVDPTKSTNTFDLDGRYIAFIPHGATNYDVSTGTLCP
jgi:hypothetical protein